MTTDAPYISFIPSISSLPDSSPSLSGASITEIPSSTIIIEDSTPFNNNNNNFAGYLSNDSPPSNYSPQSLSPVQVGLNSNVDYNNNINYNNSPISSSSSPSSSTPSPNHSYSPLEIPSSSPVYIIDPSTSASSFSSSSENNFQFNNSLTNNIEEIPNDLLNELISSSPLSEFNF